MKVYANKIDLKNNVFVEPMIHILNKSSVGSQLLSPSTNYIVLGDSLGDAHMADGTKKFVFRIGFCNHNIEKWLELYKSTFDVVLINDTSFEFIINLIQSLNK